MEDFIKPKEFTLSQNDIIAFTICTMIKRPIFKLLIGVLILLAISVLLPFFLERSEASFPYQAFIVIVLVMIALPGLFYLASVREYKNNKALQTPRTYAICWEALSINSDLFNGVIKWDVMKDITENKKYFFFWVSKDSVHIMPKSILNEDDIYFIREVKRARF